MPVKGKIKPDESLADGRVLARLTDLGWGGALRELFAAGAPDRAVDPGHAAGLRPGAARMGRR